MSDSTTPLETLDRRKAFLKELNELEDKYSIWVVGDFDPHNGIAFKDIIEGETFEEVDDE